MRQLSGMLIVAVGLFLLAGCGQTTPVQINASGAWAGTITDDTNGFEAPMSLTLTDASGTLTGTGTVGGVVTVDVIGNRSGNSATMELTGPFLTEPVQVDGHFTTSSFSGTWYVPNSQDTASVALQRQ